MNHYQHPEMSDGPGVTTAAASAPTAVRRSLYTSMPLLLALLATLTSLGIAALSGLQRGGALPEQFGNIALAVAAVLATHLLPALCRSKPLAVRFAAACMWAVSIVVVFYGQMTFFLLAQQHAGDLRAEGVPETTQIVPVAATPMRSLTAIGKEQERVRTLLAGNNARHCDVDCPAQRMRREVLTAKLDALTTEADEAKRQQVRDDRQAALADRATRLRDSLRDDPVTARLSALIGLDAQKLNLLLALVCAGVLDCMGSLCWWLSLDGSRAAVTPGVTAVVSQDNASRHAELNPASDPTSDAYVTDADEIDSRLVQLARDVAAGELNPTVDGIRRHLRCAQKKANELHREFHALRLALQAGTSQV